MQGKTNDCNIKQILQSKNNIVDKTKQFDASSYNSFQSNIDYSEYMSNCNEDFDWGEFKVLSTNLDEITPIRSKNSELLKNKNLKNVDGVSLSQSPKKKRTVREDVMNKNILRLIRRQWKNLFNSFCQINNIKIVKRNEWFMNAVIQFAHYLLSFKPLKFSDDSLSDKVLMSYRYSPDKCDFVVYLGIFIDYCTMKRILEENPNRSKLFEINDVLYSFTQTKFYDFITIPEVKTIINIVWNKVDMKRVISNNKSFKKHQEDYQEHISELFSYEKDL